MVSKKQHYEEHKQFWMLNDPLSLNVNLVPAFKRRLEWILKHVEADTLDIGCNDGGFTVEIAKKLHKSETPSKIVVGIDILELNIKRAWDNVPEEADWADNISFDVGDAEDLDFKDGSFDTVVMTETLEHTRYPRRALEEIHRVLTKEGKLLLSVPNGISREPTHYNQIDLGGIYKLLEKLFTVVELTSDEASIYLIGRKE